jgi:hypothetical protein
MLKLNSHRQDKKNSHKHEVKKWEWKELGSYPLPIVKVGFEHVLTKSFAWGQSWIKGHVKLKKSKNILHKRFHTKGE